MEKISVAVRLRPLSSSDCSKGVQWKVVDNTISLCSPFGTPVSGQAFTFDHVFEAGINNATIYQLHTRGVITSALRGFNGTVFAYGQTSSGKTYTMRGTKSELGLIGLAVQEVFSDVEKFVDREFLIRVSYMEIYNEDINDLLAPDNRKLQVHENLEKGIFVAGLREEIVNSPEQVFELLEFGEAHRHVGQTNMNVYSSRSHTIFRMVIESKDKSAGVCTLDAVRVSVLNLVDLAGSERVAKTGAGGVRLKEGTHINKSLMTLGNVIKKLSDGAAKQGGHIPYRDSKLTRILQPALGGNAKTAIICTIAPDEVHIDESRGTLLFASRAKRVTTCAQVNEILTDAALLKRQQREIEELRKKLKGFQSEISEDEILRLRNDLLKYELEKEMLELELQEERKAQLEREQRIKEQELKIENLSSLVVSSALDDAFNKENGRFLDTLPSQSSFQNRLITVRRERHQSPPSFDRFPAKEENDMGEREPLMPLEFGNVADEDLWLSLNDGQALAGPDFLLSTPNRWTSSVGSTKEQKSSSVAGVLMSSRVKLEKYRSQLEEAWKENSALRNQLVEESTFQRQLGSQLIEVEQGFLGTKNMTESLKEIWDAFRQAKVLTSKTLNDMLLTERQRIKATMTHADELRDVCFQKLTERVQELEGELLNCRKENSELQFRCQALQDQLQLSSTVIQKDSRTGSEQNLSEEDMQAAPLNCTHEKLSSPAANFQEAGTVDTKSNQFDDQLSDGGFGSKQRMAVPMLKVDLWSGSTPKDYKVGLRDDSWLKHEGSGALGTILNTEAGHEDQDEVKEMLMMSREQIRTLERQLLLANLEKDRASSLLTEHIQAHEKSMVAMKLEKLKFAEELKSIMEAIALQDSFVTSICHGIEEYEKGVDHECPTLRMQVISG